MNSDAATPVVSLQGVCKTYGIGAGVVHALQGIDLTFDSGEFVAIMGSSGSGKSTLMNILGCLDRPSSGLCRIGGVEVSTLSRSARADLRNRKVGFVFQDFNLLSRTSALENVEMPMLYHPQHIGRAEMHRRAVEALQRVGLADRVHHHPNQLSGGQQQRVAIARALVNRPHLLLADEPTGNLDTLTSLEIMSLFQELNADGLTVLLVTHEPDIARFTRRMLVLRDGRVLSDAAVDNPLSAVAAKQRFIAADDTGAQGWDNTSKPAADAGAHEG